MRINNSIVRTYVLNELRVIGKVTETSESRKRKKNLDGNNGGNWKLSKDKSGIQLHKIILTQNYLKILNKKTQPDKV